MEESILYDVRTGQPNTGRVSCIKDGLLVVLVGQINHYEHLVLRIKKLLEKVPPLTFGVRSQLVNKVLVAFQYSICPSGHTSRCTMVEASTDHTVVSVCINLGVFDSDHVVTTCRILLEEQMVA